MGNTNKVEVSLDTVSRRLLERVAKALEESNRLKKREEISFFSDQSGVPIKVEEVHDEHG